MDQQYQDLIVAFLPVGILEYFDLSDIKKAPAGLCIYLEEKNQLPEEFKGQPYHSKGFYPGVQIEDFPIRTKKVYLCMGTRMTKEFAAFLKEFNRISTVPCNISNSS